jgi:hypothetical protein
LVHDDVLTCAPPVAPVDVIWGQSAWAHFPDPQSFLARWLPILGPRGRVAFEDSCLKRNAADRSERALLDRLQESRQAHLRPPDAWREALAVNGCDVGPSEDLSEPGVDHYARMLRVCADWPTEDQSEREIGSWRDAMAALRLGLIGHFRIIGIRAG